MSAPKFTNGPWSAEADADSEGMFRASIMDDDLRVEIALVTQDVSYDRDDGRATVAIKRRTAEANARLIAAAPEMFALAERVAAGFVRGESAEDTIRNFMAQARAIIGKVSL